MKNIHNHSEEMRTDAGELVVVLNGVATDMATEEGLARGAETAFGLAPEIEEATTPGAPNAAYAESQTVEFWNWVPALDRKQAEAAADAVSNNEEAGADLGQASVAVHEQILVANQEHPAQLYRRLPWLSVIILVAIAGAYAIANNGSEQGWSYVPVVESKPGPSPEPREELKPAIAAAEPLKDPQPVEPEERALTSEQIAVPPPSQTIGSLPAIADIEVKDANYHRARGLLAYRSGDLSLALVDFDLAIKLDPNFSNAYIDRAIVLHRMGDLEHAFADIAQAKRINESRRSQDRAVAERVTNLENAHAEIVQPTARHDATRPPRHQKSVVNLHRGDPARVCLWCSSSSWLQSFRLIDYFAWHPKYRRQSGVRH